MLLTQEAEVKLTKRNIEYYLEKGYSGKLKDVITVKTMDLPPYSSIPVTYRCDMPDCNKEHTLRFEDYYKHRNRNYASLGDFCDACSKKAKKQWEDENCPELKKERYEKVWQKAHETIVELYGVDNIMQDANYDYLTPIDYNFFLQQNDI